MFIACIVSIPIINAQQIQVINSSTGDPIENVAIYNQSKSKSILTNERGYADIKQFSVGDTLYLQHTSFVPNSFSYERALDLGLIGLSRRVVILPDFVISASKYRETQQDIPHMVDVIGPTKLNNITSQNSADILTSTGNIFVQKSQGGGGSPVLRGFEANKILLVVDGVRMNNAIYRSGHLQNSVTIDNNILEKAEVVYGPNAIMYGSDALGGVIHYITRDPDLASDSDKFVFNAGAYGQVATANSSWKTHLDFNLGGRKFGSLTSITQGDYGDIKMGKRRDPFLGDFGKDFSYVERINDVDSIFQNSNPNIQRNTSYRQTDILQKFRFKPNRTLDFIGNLQYSTSSRIPRYDQLNDTTSDGLPRYAEWSYGPQDRFLGSIKSIIWGDNLFFSSITTTLAYQHLNESRISRKFNDEIRNVQTEIVDVATANIDVMKVLKKSGHIIYGFEYTTNNVISEAYDEELNTGFRAPATTRYPDNGSWTASYGAYISMKNRLGPKILSTLGARYSYSMLHANYSDNFEYIPYKSIHIENSSFTGSAGLIGQFSESFNINFLLSTGYRVPNLDDLAKIRVKNNQITFPNPYIKPEYSYNVEAGLSKTFDGYIQINGSYYVTYITNLIARVPYHFGDGSDSMWYNGEYLYTYANDNSDEGLIHGFNLNLVSDLNSNISFKTTLNYTFGKNLSLDEPMAHIPPIFGRADLVYEVKRFVHEISLVYSGWKRIEDMSTTGEDNIEEGTEYGFPGWYTFNLSSTYKANKKISVQFAINNVMDNFYKPFASGIAAPGFNFIATLRVKV